MRVLLIAPVGASDSVSKEIAEYRSYGSVVCVNEFLLAPLQRNHIRAAHRSDNSVEFASFDPDVPDYFATEFCRCNIGYDAVVIPYPYRAISPQSLGAIMQAQLQRRLTVLGVPNDSRHHIESIVDYAVENNIAIVCSHGVHAASVAEYTLCQIGFHARRLLDFYRTIPSDRLAAHREAVATTHRIAGKTIGVVGASGLDGTAVVEHALQYGLRVVCCGSRSQQVDERLKRLGATLVQTIEELCESSDFLSINIRACDETLGLINDRVISSIRKGAIVVCATKAEVFNEQALRNDLCRPDYDRRIRALVLDMPFGWSVLDNRSNDDDISQIPGVFVTPRVAGYTVDSHSQASIEIARHICRHKTDANSFRTLAVSECSAIAKMRADELLEDLLEIVAIAGEKAVTLRESTLTTAMDAAGSISTNADVAVSSLIKDELQRRNWVCQYSGEEFGDCNPSSSEMEIVIDGIDGTRNFRDRNYGWCISVAACVDDEPQVAVVYDHHCRETYYAIKDRGAFVVRAGTKEHIPLIVPEFLPIDFSFSIGSFRVGGSSERKANITEQIKALGGRGREWGSVALSICGVARGGLGVFLQADSFRHDHIAAVTIAIEAKAFVYKVYRPEKSRCDIVVSHPTLAKRVQQIFEDGDNTD